MKHSFFFSSAALFLSANVASAADAAQWASRSIYQVLTDRFALTDGSDPECDLYKYCGGTWAGITNKLDYIQGMGFSAVQISPVVQNFPENTKYGEAFHGYWPINMYALNENFGTAEDLKNLAAALHQRGMYLMVDVVMNNMALPIEGTMKVDTVLDYSRLHPFDDAKYYHPYCQIDYSNDTSSQNCWIADTVVALPDLDTEKKEVIDVVHSWIKELVSNYSIDGLRIDAAKHVDDKFLKSFVEAAGVFTFGEIYASDSWQVCRYQGALVDGLPDFPIYYPAVAAFTNESLTILSSTVKEVQERCQNISYMGTFSENHDLPRFAELDDDMDKALNIMAFTILADGIPSMYQGQEQHFKGNFSPWNRSPLWPTKYSTSSPIYNLTGTLNTLRTHAITSDPFYLGNQTQELFVSNHTYATRKGSSSSPSNRIVAVYTNIGSSDAKNIQELTLENAFAADIEVVDVLSCEKSMVARDGSLKVQMGSAPKAFYPSGAMDGSGLCGFSNVKKVQETPTATDPAANPTATGTKDEPKKDAGVVVRPGIVGLALGLVMAVGVYLL